MVQQQEQPLPVNPIMRAFLKTELSLSYMEYRSVSANVSLFSDFSMSAAATQPSWNDRRKPYQGTLHCRCGRPDRLVIAGITGFLFFCRLSWKCVSMTFRRSSRPLGISESLRRDSCEAFRTWIGVASASSQGQFPMRFLRWPFLSMASCGLARHIASRQAMCFYTMFETMPFTNVWTVLTMLYTRR